MTSYIGLLMIAGVVVFIVWLGRRTKRLTTEFWNQVNKAGFDRAATLPASLGQTRPFLSARGGSPPQQTEDTLFLIGSTQGAMVSVGNGASVVTRNYFIGFLLPERLALDETDLPAFRKGHPQIVSFEALPDGSQIFLWPYPWIPGNLQKVLAALQEARQHSAYDPARRIPKASVETAIPEQSASDQAVTERILPKGPPAKRFYAVGIYGSNDPSIEAHVRGFFSCASAPTAADFDQSFLAEAKNAFARMQHPEVQPTHMKCQRLHTLPALPLPAEQDHRPWQHWKVTAGIDCPDIKRGYSLSGVFGWPEEPSGALLQQMLMFLAVNRLVEGDNHPEDAEYGYFADQRVVPTTEDLTDW